MVEDLVNEKILEDLPVQKGTVAFTEGQKRGAIGVRNAFRRNSGRAEAVYLAATAPGNQSSTQFPDCHWQKSEPTCRHLEQQRAAKRHYL